MKDEKQLLDQYRKSGDLRLLGKLYEPYMPLLYGVCLRYFQDQQRSEDAVMEIFESLVTKLRQHEVTHFKSWLYTLTRNYCLMELRKTGGRVALSLDDVESGNLEAATQAAGEIYPDADFDPVKEDRLVLMESCLAQLSEEQRRCVDLFYLKQMCYRDIADQTGYDMKKVKSYIQNGKRNLKRCMEHAGE